MSDDEQDSTDDRADVNEWDASADGWDDDEYVRAYGAAAFDSLQAILGAGGPSLDGAQVVDFGCGTGILTEQLVAAGATVNAVDTSEAMLAVLDAKIADRGCTGVETSTDLPDAPGTVDVVVCSSVCAFVDDYPGTVATLVNLLRPGGHFVQWDWERTGDDPYGLTRSEIRSALGAADLTDIVVDAAFRVTFGDMTMAPLVGHGRRPNA